MNQKSPTADHAAIGQRIRSFRLRMKMSQTDLGDQIGVTFQQIQKYEKGMNRVDSVRLAKIAAILGTTSQVLMALDEDQTTASDGLSLILTTRQGIELVEAYLHMPATSRAALVVTAKALAGM